MAFSSTSSARMSRNKRISAERQKNWPPNSRYSGNHSPPPLSQTPSTSSSSPPDSPEHVSSRVPLSLHSAGRQHVKQNSYPQMQGQFFGQNRNSPTNFSRSRPPMISPVMPHSPSRSWDEGEERPSNLRPRLHGSNRSAHHQPIPLKQTQSDLTGSFYSKQRNNPNPRLRSNESQSPQNDFVFNETVNTSSEELRFLNNRFDRSRSLSHPSEQFNRPPTPPNAADRRENSPTLPTTSEDELSSLGGVEDSNDSSSPSLMRIVLAIRNNSNRPSNLTLEEKALWDAVQAAKRQARLDGMANCIVRNGGNSRSAPDSPTNVSNSPDCSVDPQSPSPEGDATALLLSNHSDSWDSRFLEAQEQAVRQQRENSRSLRAIQQVLAEVQAERDKAVEQLVHLQESASVPPMVVGDDIDSVADQEQHDEMESLQQDLKVANSRIDDLERELRNERIAKLKMDTTDSSAKDQPVLLFDLQQKIMQLENENQRLRSDLESKSNELRNAIAPGASPCTSKDVVDRLRKDLIDKTSALENAKMIITSLENASNTLAADSRAKLRAKDEKYNRLKQESTERQKTLDTLATELRDLQRANVNAKGVAQDLERSRRLTLSSRLEKDMAEIRAAAVVLEATQDPVTLHSIAKLLSDSIEVLKEGIDVIENSADGDSYVDADSVCSGGHDSPRIMRSANDSRKLRKELDEKKRTIKQLEDNLRRCKDDIKKIRTEAEHSRRRRDEEVQSLHAEIKILRQQCNTNMEVLTRKERELAVLRDSLQVEDDGVGYISDDNSEDEDEIVSGTTPRPSINSQYGPSQAEALATLLAQGGNHSFDSSAAGAVSGQIDILRAELAKVRAEHEKTVRELKVEKDSLSNAKMIISSLESANKRMMEDLRSRLQDSNSAIASLLEKSLESEKTSSRLRAELADALQRERERSYTEQIDHHALMVLPSYDDPVETID